MQIEKDGKLFRVMLVSEEVAEKVWYQQGDENDHFRDIVPADHELIFDELNECKSRKSNVEGLIHDITMRATKLWCDHDPLSTDSAVVCTHSYVRADTGELVFVAWITGWNVNEPIELFTENNVMTGKSLEECLVKLCEYLEAMEEHMEGLIQERLDKLAAEGEAMVEAQGFGD